MGICIPHTAYLITQSMIHARYPHTCGHKQGGMYEHLDNISYADAEALNPVDDPGPPAQPLFRLLAFIREPLPPGAKHVRLCPCCRMLKLMMSVMIMMVMVMIMMMMVMIMMVMMMMINITIIHIITIIIIMIAEAAAPVVVLVMAVVVVLLLLLLVVVVPKPMMIILVATSALDL